MGAFLSGLLGAAGNDIESKEKRAYEEKKSERDNKRKLVLFAAETAIQKGLYNELPSIFGELDDIGTPSNAPKGVKDSFARMGGIFGKLVHTQKQRQGQQAGQAQGQQDVQQAPGVTAQPQTTTGFSGQQFQLPPAGQPGGMQPGQMTPPMPAPRAQRVWDRLGPEIAAQEEEQYGRKTKRGEAEFETELKHTGRTQQATFDQKLKEVDQLIKQGYPKQEAQQIVFGRAAAPAGQKFAPFYISGAQVPPETQVDALGNPIDRENGRYKLEETSGKFYPVTAGPSAKTGPDELARMAKIILAKKGITKPTEAEAAAATQEAGADLFRNKVTNPQERIELTKNAVRTIMGENQVLITPTHVPGAGRRGPVTIPFSGIKPAPTTPALPPPSKPVVRAGGAVAPTESTGFTPKVEGAERGRKDTAEVILKRGGAGIAVFSQLAQKRPDLFGPGAKLLDELVKTIGVADPLIGKVKGAMDSFTGFLPALHGYRSTGILAEWKRTLDNPLKNPQYTMETMREVMKAAEEVRNSILKRDTGPMTAEGEEEKATGKGKRKVYNEATGDFEER